MLSSHNSTVSNISSNMGMKSLCIRTLKSSAVSVGNTFVDTVHAFCEIQLNAVHIHVQETESDLCEISSAQTERVLVTLLDDAIDMIYDQRAKQDS